MWDIACRNDRLQGEGQGTVIVTVTLNASLDKTYSVPGFAIGRDLVAERVEFSPGGKGLNVASFARALGADVLATGILAGNTGRHVQDLLTGRRIPHDFVWVPGESRSCHIIHDPIANSLSQVREPGPAVPRETRAAVAAKVRELAGRARLVVLSGSLPPGLETDVYQELVGIVRDQQVPVILDAAGEPLELGLAARPTMIKPNLHELDELARRLGMGAAPAGPMDKAAHGPSAAPHEPQATAQAASPSAHASQKEAPEAKAVRRWAAAVGRAVYGRFRVRMVASLGPLGAVVTDGDTVYAVVPPAVEAVNTISCGDALVAGIAVALTRGQSLAQGVRLGVAAATAKARLFATGTLNPQDVDSLLPRVHVHGASLD